MIISLLIHKSRTVQSDGWSSGVSLRPCRAFYWLQGKNDKDTAEGGHNYTITPI